MGACARVDYNLTICSLQSRLQHIYHGRPYARVDLNPMPVSTLSPSHGLWIWLLYVVIFYGLTTLSPPVTGPKTFHTLTLDWTNPFSLAWLVADMKLPWRHKLMVPDRLWYCTDCVVRGCPFSSSARPAARQSFVYKWGAAGWGGIVYVYVWLRSALMTPQKATYNAKLKFLRMIKWKF